MIQREKRKEITLMIASSALGALGSIFIYDRYTSPDRIQSKTLLDVDYSETNEDVIVDTLEDDFHREIRSSIDGHMHGAAETAQKYTKKLDTVCYVFGSLCNRITIKHGNFTAKERYTNVAIPLYLTHYFDNNKTREKPLKKTINNISIYRKEGRRGYANNKNILINTHEIKSTREYLEIMTHEMGHIIDLGAIEGKSSHKNSQYTEFGKKVFAIDDHSINYYKLSRNNERTRKAGQTRYDFCSGYGQSNPFEDFAECFNLYINHHDLFRHITSRSRTIQRKYTYIHKLMNGFSVYRDSETIEKYQDPKKLTPFDTSRINST